MTKPIGLAGLLLITTALTAPAAMAQTAQDQATAATPATTPPAQEAPQDEVEISSPGGVETDIVVTGRYIPEPIRATSEVVSVLSSADIARTGEGDIAGALQRVTGLSVVGNGFVYVRGLGDRYSLALLNGSPLPSPEPLKRVVPLDIFPSSVIASAVVQKSYSPNFPGEFGGGVINLTTTALPKESFLDIKGGISGNSETTGYLGYTYYGSRTDWTGFDNGSRDVPGPLAAAMATGRPIGIDTLSPDKTFTERQLEMATITSSLVNAQTSLLQRNKHIPANFSAEVSGGWVADTSGGTRIGLIASAGFDNSWRTRDTIKQESTDPDLGGLVNDGRAVITDNHIVVNGLLGVGAEFGEHKIRWTNLYIRDTLKQGRLQKGLSTVSETKNYITQNTAWYERQLIDTQLVGEFKFGDFGVDVRGGYANTQREAPYEREFEYVYNAEVDDYVNNLSQQGDARISFSDLNEDLYSGAVDLSYKAPTARSLTFNWGYAYTKQARSSTRRDFRFVPELDSLNLGVSQERPDYLLSDYNVATYGIYLREATGSDGAGAFDAGLTIYAGYGQANAELFDGFSVNVGARYEDAHQFVTPLGLDGLPTASFATTKIDNAYWLPAATITWNFAEDMQLRLSASKTLARPQFRELAQQIYRDTDSDRSFIGNPFLQDSRLTNAEARYEWYFARGQRLTAAAFYKKIDNPIETFSFYNNGIVTSFANAPGADLYGAEFEAQKYVPLSGLMGESPFWASRRLVLIANYTYSKSKLKVGADDVARTPIYNGPASGLFNDGDPLTGQSDHLVNLQVGFEDEDRLSQQTLLFTYASDRVTSRGLQAGTAQQPPIVEKPGIRLDFVARQGVRVFGQELELKAEARNITGTKFQELQTLGDNKVYINRYKLGTSYAFSATMKF
ncbi:TonB-dependent receptor [Sphingobium sp. H39-3-25]|uniref:TonB-dependent receptor domain-containing protein n=1 Tax=Sphingobium arseniciresistens TaxID=3030834 RepID=UPI0023B974EF|nr:TonB-dependent receptor [Sphingobium arseniciresistens]